MERKPLDRWKRKDKFICGRIHVRPKHLLEALDEAKSRTATKVNSLELRQLCGIENMLQDMTI
jgi:hypothetical protein